MIMVRYQNRFSRCLAAVFCIFVFASAPTYAMSGSAHTSLSKQFISGMSTQTMREIHSKIIDTVPWRDRAGGKGHREQWGHSDEWYYGKMKKTVPKEHLDSVKDLPNITGREYIALEFRKAYPLLTKKESLAVADLFHDSHLLGDSTTPEGKNIPRQEIIDRVKHPTLKALSAMNKAVIAEIEGKARSENSPGQTVIYTSGNKERFIVQGMVANGEKAYRVPPLDSNGEITKERNTKDLFGVTREGQNYVLAVDVDQIPEKLNSIIPKDNVLILVPSDVYETYKIDCLKKGITPDNRVVADTEPSTKWDNDAKKQYNEIKAAMTFAKAKTALKNAAPGLIAGGLQAIGENWKDITAAWNGEKEWDEVLTKVGSDFAGYTLTPMIVDGVIAQLPNKMSVLLAPIKNAGTRTIVGIFIFGAGKEFYSYYIGDQDWDETVVQLKKRTGTVGQQIVVYGATIIYNKVAAVFLTSLAVPAPWIPVVIVAGSTVWQIGKDYLAKERWRQTIYVEDISGFLGEGFVREFHLLCPERRSNILDLEQSESIFEPEYRDNLLVPELRDNILQPIR
ncbi:MAG: hypothetical protein ACOYD9_05845 [Pyramidobacter sp.]|jgi:hypothetical protein